MNLYRESSRKSPIVRLRPFFDGSREISRNKGMPTSFSSIVATSQRIWTSSTAGDAIKNHLGRQINGG